MSNENSIMAQHSTAQHSTAQHSTAQHKLLIPCKLDKCSNGEFLSLNDAKICDFPSVIASTITSRYYKGIGGHHDNMVIEIWKK